MTPVSIRTVFGTHRLVAPGAPARACRGRSLSCRWALCRTAARAADAACRGLSARGARISREERGTFSLVGFCNGASSAAQALLVANTPPGRIGSALSRLQTGMLVGQTLGPAVATMAVAVVSRSHWLFWFSGSLLLVISLHRDRPRAFLRRAHRPGARPARLFRADGGADLPLRSCVAAQLPSPDTVLTSGFPDVRVSPRS